MDWGITNRQTFINKLKLIEIIHLGYSSYSSLESVQCNVLDCKFCVANINEIITIQILIL